MNGSEDFLETLHKLGFPDVNKYQCSDLDPMFADEKLKPLFESFCKLNEENVLTTEELAEYAAIPSEELAFLESLAQKDNQFETNTSAYEKSKECQFLEEQLALINENNTSLQRQKDSLKSHKSLLSEEKDRSEKALMVAKKKFEVYAVQKVPQAETELVSVLKSICSIIMELQDLITDSDNEIKKAGYFKEFENYLDEERQLSNYVEDFLRKNFEIHCDFKDFVLKVPGYSEDEILKEVQLLRQVLKDSLVAKHEVTSQREKLSKNLEFYKKCEDENFSHIFKISAPQCWAKLAEEDKLQEKLLEKEKSLRIYLSNTISEYIDAQCSKIGNKRSEEIMQAHNACLEKIQAPLEQMISQRSRLEFLILCLNSYGRKFDNLKQLVDFVSNYIKREKEEILEKKAFYEDVLTKEIPVKNQYLLENSISMSVYKILSNDVQQHFSFVSIDDALKEVEKLHLQKEILEKSQEQNLSIINRFEEQKRLLEKLTFQGNEFSKLSESDMNFNVKLNKMDLKLSTLQKNISESQMSMDQKKKLLERSKNLRLARSLYLHALLDEELFLTTIQEIKKAAENSTDLFSCQNKNL